MFVRLIYFSVILKIKSSNLCKPIHGIINYSTSICLFRYRNCGKEGNKLQKFDYLEDKKSFLDETKTCFIVFEGLSLGKKKKKKFDKNLWTQTLNIKKPLPLLFLRNFICIVIKVLTERKYVTYVTWYKYSDDKFHLNYNKLLHVYFSRLLTIYEEQQLNCITAFCIFF